MVQDVLILVHVRCFSDPVQKDDCSPSKKKIFQNLLSWSLNVIGIKYRDSHRNLKQTIITAIIVT